MAARMPARSLSSAPISSARMLAANVVPCAVPATRLAMRNRATTPACSEIRMTATAAVKASMPSRCAVAGPLRPARGAPMALGAISDAKTRAATSVLEVPSWSAATDGPKAW